MNEHWDGLWYGLKADPESQGLLEGEWRKREAPPPPRMGLLLRGSEAMYRMPVSKYGVLDAYLKARIRPDELKIKNIGLRYKYEF